MSAGKEEAGKEEAEEEEAEEAEAGAGGASCAHPLKASIPTQNMQAAILKSFILMFP